MVGTGGHGFMLLVCIHYSLLVLLYTVGVWSQLIFWPFNTARVFRFILYSLIIFISLFVVVAVCSQSTCPSGQYRTGECHSNINGYKCQGGP